ncbi:MAG: glycosyltransferase family 4 protein [Paludibacteraceae bacterium]|nr:glycosyltransferase family 4 protein [Paludibacteraceae bacterium]
MKIVLCDNRLGGLLGFRREVILHLVEQGYQVTLVAPRATTNWDMVGKPLPCVRIVNVPMSPSGLNPFSDLRTYFAYRRIFREIKPDIVFTYTIKPNIYAGLAAKSLNIKCVSMFAGLGYIFEGDNFLRRQIIRFYKWGVSGSKYVLVLNQMIHDQLLAKKIVNEERIILLSGGEGINLDEFPYSETNYTSGIRFVLLARVLYDKGYTEFVQAAKVIHRQFKNTYFEILGPLAYDSPMGVEDAVFEADRTAGYFRYLGVTNAVQEFLSSPNVVLVLPSYHEGMSRSLMEGLAIGRPIITTDIPGCRETVEEGKNGYLVPKADTSKLIAAIKRFIALPEKEKERMASYSRHIAETKFDVRNVIQVYDQIIEKLKTLC